MITLCRGRWAHLDFSSSEHADLAPLLGADCGHKLWSLLVFLHLDVQTGMLSSAALGNFFGTTKTSTLQSQQILQEFLMLFFVIRAKCAHRQSVDANDVPNAVWIWQQLWGTKNEHLDPFLQVRVTQRAWIHQSCVAHPVCTSTAPDVSSCLRCDATAGRPCGSSSVRRTDSSCWPWDAAFNEHCVEVALQWEGALQDVSQYFVLILGRAPLLLLFLMCLLLIFGHTAVRENR